MIYNDKSILVYELFIIIQVSLHSTYTEILTENGMSLDTTDDALKLAKELENLLVSRSAISLLLAKLCPLLRDLRYPITQQKMARIADVDQRYISNVENGIIAKIGEAQLLRIIRAYIELG